MKVLIDLNNTQLFCCRYQLYCATESQVVNASTLSI